MNTTKSKLLALVLAFSLVACSKHERHTTISINKDQFYINGDPTYKSRYWQGNKIEGLLLNSRMVQGIFDDTNPETKENFIYPDTKKWDTDRNTSEFISHMETWRSYGLLAFTLNLQGGSPISFRGPISNSAFDKVGNLKPEYLGRLERILDEADELGMVVILGYFYFGQDEYLENEAAVIHAVDTITQWILDKNYKNILVEINNECNLKYDHEILQPERVHELITRVQNKKKDGYRLLVSTSFSGATAASRGGIIPSSTVISAADFILVHANGITKSTDVTALIEATRKSDDYVAKPILINEDDNYNFESDTSNFVTAVRAYASWGYYDFRREGEAFEDGYQSVPVDWGINSERKQGFFTKLREITTEY